MKLNKVNPIGENSPNLVTLLISAYHLVIESHEVQFSEISIYENDNLYHYLGGIIFLKDNL
jgi:hypothetical protein